MRPLLDRVPDPVGRCRSGWRRRGMDRRQVRWAVHRARLVPPPLLRWHVQGHQRLEQPLVSLPAHQVLSPPQWTKFHSLPYTHSSFGPGFVSSAYDSGPPTPLLPAPPTRDHTALSPFPVPGRPPCSSEGDRASWSSGSNGRMLTGVPRSDEVPSRWLRGFHRFLLLLIPVVTGSVEGSRGRVSR